MLNMGNWNRTQIVSSEWVAESTQADPADPRDFGDFESIPGFRGYQYHWWLVEEGGAFFGDGKLGQILYVNPKERIIIVRLGRTGEYPVDWLTVFETLAPDVK